MGNLKKVIKCSVKNMNKTILQMTVITGDLMRMYILSEFCVGCRRCCYWALILTHNNNNNTHSSCGAVLFYSLLLFHLQHSKATVDWCICCRALFNPKSNWCICNRIYPQNHHQLSRAEKFWQDFYINLLALKWNIALNVIEGAWIKIFTGF